MTVRRMVVVGGGYVGLPLAALACGSGCDTCVYDVDREKVASINRGQSYIGDVKTLPEGLVASHDPSVLAAADAIIICVPTPLRKTKDPDISMIMAVAEDLRPRLHHGQLVILESTVYPGFTREILAPYLSATGLKAGKDFHLAFSPERVDPGNEKYQTHNTPKVLGGYSPACGSAAWELYSHLFDRVVQVSTCDVAEMVKLLENTFRAVNIGLVNEVALMCRKLGIDTWEVIDAAATKPFGFMPFYPGPGLGGHCIPVDPHYLSWKLKTLKYNARFIELASEVNSSMPGVVAQMVSDALNEQEKPVKGSKILILGVAYKPDIDDVRESPALDLMDLLGQKGALLSYHDPHVPKMYEMVSVTNPDLGSYDCVVVVANHACFDYGALAKQAPLVVDTRHACPAAPNVKVL